MERQFDNLNDIKTREDQEAYIEDYFNSMDIPRKQIDERIDFAKESNDILTLIFLYLMVQNEVGAVNQEAVKKTFVENYKIAISSVLDLDDNLNSYTERFADEVLSVTQSRLGEELKKANIPLQDVLDNSYWLSEGRMVDIAVNMSMDIMNYKDYITAIKRGFKHKKWLSINDKRVRKTHQKVDGKVIPMGEYFHVGDAVLAFPHDTITEGSTGAEHLEEIANCRCFYKYVP